ncbi:family 78 glycoside hydrolase catalytic domain [Agriterribacter sp.]|uniref:family 78 glycoside hydrolase catalytic domain n=1 Tax=Agriterribacter sp. TaxID=2821509 RepID=UPI002C84BF52|nr:family 78 glycoside hydrolase catalytic domain [Agriterribacter sp.]HRP55632.1 family 78 glycoside hydrolase catalytic domain [Agriterribacter sp.]
MIRKNIIYLVLLSVISFTSPQCVSEKKGVVVKDLRCEYLNNPLGIDIVKPNLGWIIETADDLKNVTQVAYRILVASSPEVLEKNIGDIWDSEKVLSANSTHVSYGEAINNSPAGEQLGSETQCYWKVKVWIKGDDNNEMASEWSSPAIWTMGLLNASDWSGKWIGLNGDAEIKDTATEHRRLAARMLRRAFPVTKNVSRATAYVSGLGFFDYYVNGKLISDQLMNPALSGYNKRILYVTFDVTKELKEGENAMGVILGNGRFFAPRKKVPVPMHNYGYPRLLMQLHIEYEDGSREVIASDEKWKGTADGPVRANNEYDGEEYDARLEMPGWAEAGFDDERWKTAEVLESPGGRMEAQVMEPIRVTEVLHPKRFIQPKPGIWMVDFGQSFYGVVRLKVKGPRGTTVSLHTSFNILPDSTLKYQNDRSALNTDKYTLSGNGTEVWHPRFKGNATRWIQVSGFPGTPDSSNFEGLVTHTDFEQTGKFTSSNELLNRVYLNARWGTRMQNRSLPMEPDRDERMPWSGHPSKTSESEGWVFNVAKFYDHFLHNYRVHQGTDGSLQEILPPYWTFNSKGILWPSVATIIPDWMYSFYGDPRILKDNYRMMKDFVLFTQKAYLKADYTTDFCDYGDWVNAINMGGSGEQTPKGLMGTAYIYHNARIVERAAGILGNTEDEQYFKTLADSIYIGFNDRFLDKQTGVYQSGSQCAYVLPLAFGMVPETQKEKVVSNLVNDIMVTRKGHTSVGLIGMQWQMQVLTSIGHPEVAYTIATRTDLPSWGYMISKGATTSWELWNSDTTGPGMNGESQKILSGNFEAWCYQTLGGINYDTEQPGFKHIILKPEPVGDLKFVKASFRSLYGLISSEWEKDENRFNWNIMIPPNTTASVYVPSGEKEKITIDKTLLDNGNFRYSVDQKTQRIVITLGSGNYNIVCRE